MAIAFVFAYVPLGAVWVQEKEMQEVNDALQRTNEELETDLEKSRLTVEQLNDLLMQAQASLDQVKQQHTKQLEMQREHQLEEAKAALAGRAGLETEVVALTEELQKKQDHIDALSTSVRPWQCCCSPPT